MLLYLNTLLLLLLQPALSSPVPLTTPSRGCPTCKPKSTQTQPSVDLNATSLAVGEPCGVYTLSCAHGLRCAPPEDEPRPLRALLEGRGVCINASNISLTDNSHTVGKVHTEWSSPSGFGHTGSWCRETHLLLIYLSVVDISTLINKQVQ